MNVEVVELSPIERDAFAEIANMGVARAATSLRQMLGEQVLLSVPAVHIVTREVAAELVERDHRHIQAAMREKLRGTARVLAGDQSRSFESFATPAREIVQIPQRRGDDVKGAGHDAPLANRHELGA